MKWLADQPDDWDDAPDDPPRLVRGDVVLEEFSSTSALYHRLEGSSTAVYSDVVVDVDP